MIRRFVNLVAARRDRCVYSVHRLDVAKHLFYPSTAEAEAANAKEEDRRNHNGGGGGGGGGDMPRKPSRIERLRRLPKPIVRSQQFSPSYHHNDDDDDGDDVFDKGPRIHEMFALLSPSGRIFHATEEGHAVLYGAGDSAGSITTLPSLAGPNGLRPIAIPIASTAADDDGCHGKAYKESLYVMTSHHSRGHILEFQVLDLSQHPPKWDPLPPPPFAGKGESVSSITSFTVVDDTTICVSTTDHTYCFDTRSHRWWHAGDWMLPFDGRAEYVPELDAWIGLRFNWYYGFKDHGHLCASSDLQASMDAHREPTLQHVWEDLSPPLAEQEFLRLSRRFNEILIKRRKKWKPLRGLLINLGGRRFCIAKVFQVEQVVTCGCEDRTELEAAFVVLTGVEVLRVGEDEELRMVKHRSKRYMFTTDEIQWVL